VAAAAAAPDARTSPSHDVLKLLDSLFHGLVRIRVGLSCHTNLPVGRTKRLPGLGEAGALQKMASLEHVFLWR
jgi:hypothetical protein